MLGQFFSHRTRRTGDNCPVCGGVEFKQHPVLSEELIAEWQLAPHEVAYINRQQGHHCLSCQSNLRSRTLAAAILDHFNFPWVLKDFCIASRDTRSVRILELNEAGGLTPFLVTMRHHLLASYPEVDMQALPYAAESWEVVLHSDVLEHVLDPQIGLSECHRVLVPGGVLIYTIPIIHHRLTRTRHNLPPSYHGAPGEKQMDWLVHTEYGADFWLQPIAAGFKKVSLFTLGGPDTLAVVCRK